MVFAKKVLKTLSILILLTALLSVFAFSVSHVVKGGKRLGFLTTPVRLMAEFPQTVVEVFNSPVVKGIPPSYIKKDSSFTFLNRLAYNVYGVTSSYDQENSSWNVNLFNFRNDSLVHRWTVSREHFNQGSRQFENAELRNPIVLSDWSLIAANDETKNLYRLDKNSRIIWENHEKIFHHSLNPDHENNIWAGTRSARVVQGPANSERIFMDDHITKVDPETGKILYDKSISEILVENGYASFVYGTSNVVGYNDSDKDPLHLNDIEPVMESSAYWERGDVFVSLRNKSLVFLFDPMSGKIKRMIFGPFLNQHDVDIISENEISIFNNNFAQIGQAKGEKTLNDLGPPSGPDRDYLSSDIMVYNFRDSTFRTLMKPHFDQEEIMTSTQGFHQHLKNGDVYVENWQHGKVFIMNEKEVVYKKQLPARISEMVERPHWIRIYEDLNF